MEENQANTTVDNNHLNKPSIILEEPTTQEVMELANGQ